MIPSNIIKQKMKKGPVLIISVHLTCLFREVVVSNVEINIIGEKRYILKQGITNLVFCSIF